MQGKIHCSYKAGEEKKYEPQIQLKQLYSKLSVQGQEDGLDDLLRPVQANIIHICFKS